MVCGLRIKTLAPKFQARVGSTPSLPEATLMAMLAGSSFPHGIPSVWTILALGGKARGPAFDFTSITVEERTRDAPHHLLRSETLAVQAGSAFRLPEEGILRELFTHWSSIPWADMDRATEMVVWLRRSSKALSDSPRPVERAARRQLQLAEVQRTPVATYCLSKVWLLPEEVPTPPDAHDLGVPNSKWRASLRSYLRKLYWYRQRLQRTLRRVERHAEAAATDLPTCSACGIPTTDLEVCWNCGQMLCIECEFDHDPCAQGHDGER